MFVSYKRLKLSALAAALALTSAPSFAGQSFTIDQAAIPGFPAALLQSFYPTDNVSQIQATQINGSYNEGVTITGASGSPGSMTGTFGTSILFVGDSFTTTAANDYSGLSGTQGIPLSYGIYATFTGTGTFSQAPDGANPSDTDTTFHLSGGALNLYLDPTTATNTNLLLSGALNPAAGGLLLGSGNVIISGSGTQIVNSTTGHCANAQNNDCGSFGFTSNFALTALGSSIFTVPPTFYSEITNSGGFTAINIASGAHTEVTDAPSVISFLVPEPGSLALMGIGIFGMGFRLRKEA